MKKYLLDTNVLLRFLLKDDNKLFQKAQYHLKQAVSKKIELIVIPQVVFELDYVLLGVYKLAKNKRTDLLSTMLKTPYLNVLERDVLLQSIQLYKQKNIDLVDLYLHFLAKNSQAKVLSFDKDFNKI